jgi:Ser/Thr protein kinase RdoA (MazF antagonist)
MKVKNETQITMFDFDNCGNGSLFLDIGYSLMLFYRNDPNKERFLIRKKSFLKGYQSITKINGEKKKINPIWWISNLVTLYRSTCCKV